MGNWFSEVFDPPSEKKETAKQVINSEQIGEHAVVITKAKNCEINEGKVEGTFGYLNYDGMTTHEADISTEAFQNILLGQATRGKGVTSPSNATSQLYYKKQE